jgi:hypothetical protein
VEKTKTKKKVKEKEPELDPILVGEELLAPEPKEEKPKVFLGYHPITGEEVYL